MNEIENIDMIIDLKKKNEALQKKNEALQKKNEALQKKVNFLINENNIIQGVIEILRYQIYNSVSIPTTNIIDYSSEIKLPKKPVMENVIRFNVYIDSHFEFDDGHIVEYFGADILKIPKDSVITKDSVFVFSTIPDNIETTIVPKLELEKFEISFFSDCKYHKHDWGDKEFSETFKRKLSN